LSLDEVARSRRDGPMKSFVVRVALLAALSPAPALAAQVSAAADPPAAPPAIAFEHVHVVPMAQPAAKPSTKNEEGGGETGQRLLRDQTVIVREGRIAELGPASAVRVPEGAQRIDGAGRYLAPGLADMHVHTWDAGELALFVAYGVTTVRNMFGSPIQLMWRAQIEEGKLFGPRLYTAGPIVDGEPPVWPGSAVLVSAEEADALVLGQKQAGYDFLKAYARLERDPYDALVAAGKKHGLRVVGHVPDAVGIERALFAGQSTIEHLTGYVAASQTEDSPFLGRVGLLDEQQAWDSVDPEKLDELVLATRDAGAWNCPTLVVLQKWVQGEEAERLMQRPEMRFVAPMTRSFWSPKNNYLSKMPEDVLAEIRAADVHRKRLVGALHAAGARILLGTDMGNPFVVPGVAVHEELENLVDAGLSPYEALRAATSGAAECMGAGAEWGSVAVGSSADLVLLEADPLEDVRNARRIAGVMLRGRWHTAEELAQKLEALAAR